MKNNAYGVMKKMLSIDEEIQRLTANLKNISHISERENMEKRIDNLYADFLNYKHILEDIEVTVL